MAELSPNDVVESPGFADAVEELPGGRIQVCLLDPLPGVRPEMVEWWFGHMDAETYMWWHPTDHKDFAWVRGWEPGRYVGATHMTRQSLGGQPPLMQAEITFAPPEEWFDTSLFAGHGVGCAVCAIVHALGEDDRPLPEEMGRFVHVAIDRGEEGTEFRSCFWLRRPPDEAALERATVGRTKHVHEECRNLASFLPRLYAERA